MKKKKVVADLINSCQDNELLKDNERIDDLEVNGFRIIQNPFYFCFGMDAVLLANFANIKPESEVIDLGTGTGIIPLLLAAKKKGKSWIGIEIQEEMAEMAKRSVWLNRDLIEGELHIVCGDIKNIKELYSPGKFNAVTSNPPYMKESSGLKNPSDNKYISRHEVMVNLEEIISAAAYLLKTGGSFTMVHRPFRLPEIMELMTRYRLEPKRLQLVQPTAKKPANMVLIEGIKEAGKECRILPTLNVYKENGEYTEELLAYYGKGK